MPDRTKTVGIRLTQAEHMELTRLAGARSLRPTTYATELIRAALAGATNETLQTELGALRRQTAELREELSKVHKNVRNGIRGLLHAAADMPADEVNQWAEKWLK